MADPSTGFPKKISFTKFSFEENVLGTIGGFDFNFNDLLETITVYLSLFRVLHLEEMIF